jgi:tRNA G18 (ribose-2'-O)-methylase SpoU
VSKKGPLFVPRLSVFLVFFCASKKEGFPPKKKLFGGNTWAGAPNNGHNLKEYSWLKLINVLEGGPDFEAKTCIVLGNENWGVPEEIIHNSDVVMIPMPGIGACLNTAQTGNIILYEYNRQFTNHVRNHEYLCVG